MCSKAFERYWEVRNIFLKSSNSDLSKTTCPTKPYFCGLLTSVSNRLAFRTSLWKCCLVHRRIMSAFITRAWEKHSRKHLNKDIASDCYCFPFIIVFDMDGERFFFFKDPQSPRDFRLWGSKLLFLSVTSCLGPDSLHSQVIHLLLCVYEI